MHRLTATDTPMVRYTRTIFPSYAKNGRLYKRLWNQTLNKWVGDHWIPY